MRIFATPFNQFDGLGDGPINSTDTVAFGSRPSLQNNGTFLRINGLDSQTCVECHSVLSNAQIPVKFAVGGAGGVSANAMIGIVNPDGDDSENNGFAAIGGRFINPPALFGVGGIELLAKEMTEDLQRLRNRAQNRPGTEIDLTTKGVNFGTVVFRYGELDLSNVQGIQDDLVVRPFGRKGNFFSIRDFDIGAIQNHHGMQPVEVVGEGVDSDGDGVVNEILAGELSALHIYLASLERPQQQRTFGRVKRGRELFNELGCASCHRPTLVTRSRLLPVAFPENPENPRENVFLEIDLTQFPTRFLPRTRGVADTAPYLHDGRATTLGQAILLHGGEAQISRDNFAALSDNSQEAVLRFLRTLRTPENPNTDLQISR